RRCAPPKVLRVDGFARVVPVTGHVKPEREAAMRSISRIPPSDGPIRSAPRARIAAAILLPHPGIDREEVMSPKNAQESFRGIGPEAVLGLDRGANVLRGHSAALPLREIKLPARDAP